MDLLIILIAVIAVGLIVSVHGIRNADEVDANDKSF